MEAVSPQAFSAPHDDRCCYCRGAISYPQTHVVALCSEKRCCGSVFHVWCVEAYCIKTLKCLNRYRSLLKKRGLVHQPHKCLETRSCPVGRVHTCVEPPCRGLIYQACLVNPSPLTKALSAVQVASREPCTLTMNNMHAADQLVPPEDSSAAQASVVYSSVRDKQRTEYDLFASAVASPTTRTTVQQLMPTPPACLPAVWDPNHCRGTRSSACLSAGDGASMAGVVDGCTAGPGGVSSWHALDWKVDLSSVWTSGVKTGEACIDATSPTVVAHNRAALADIFNFGEGSSSSSSPQLCLDTHPPLGRRLNTACSGNGSSGFDGIVGALDGSFRSSVGSVEQQWDGKHTSTKRDIWTGLRLNLSSEDAVLRMNSAPAEGTSGIAAALSDMWHKQQKQVYGLDAVWGASSTGLSARHSGRDRSSESPGGAVIPAEHSPTAASSSSSFMLSHLKRHGPQRSMSVGNVASAVAHPSLPDIPLHVWPTASCAASSATPFFSLAIGASNRTVLGGIFPHGSSAAASVATPLSSGASGTSGGTVLGGIFAHGSSAAASVAAPLSNGASGTSSGAVLGGIFRQGSSTAASWDTFFWGDDANAVAPGGIMRHKWDGAVDVDSPESPVSAPVSPTASTTFTPSLTTSLSQSDSSTGSPAISRAVSTNGEDKPTGDKLAGGGGDRTNGKEVALHVDQPSAGHSLQGSSLYRTGPYSKTEWPVPTVSCLAAVRTKTFPSSLPRHPPPVAFDLDSPFWDKARLLYPVREAATMQQLTNLFWDTMDAAVLPHVSQICEGGQGVKGSISLHGVAVSMCAHYGCDADTSLFWQKDVVAGLLLWGVLRVKGYQVHDVKLHPFAKKVLLHWSFEGDDVEWDTLCADFVSHMRKMPGSYKKQMELVQRKMLYRYQPVKFRRTFAWKYWVHDPLAQFVILYCMGHAQELAAVCYQQTNQQPTPLPTKAPPEPEKQQRRSKATPTQRKGRDVTLEDATPSTDAIAESLDGSSIPDSPSTATQDDANLLRKPRRRPSKHLWQPKAPSPTTKAYPFPRQRMTST